MIGLRSIQRRLTLQALSTLLIGQVAGCDSGGKADMPLTQSLTQAAMDVASGNTLVLDKVIAQPWDHAVVFGPYTPKDSMRQVLGGDLPAVLEQIQIEQRDDVNAVVFLAGGKVAAAVALPRRVADFPKSELQRPVARAKAQLVRDASGVNFRWTQP